MSTSGLSVVELLAKASGYTEIKSRSLLITLENHVTVLLEAGKPICTLPFVYGVLRRFLPEDKVESIKNLALTADGNGAMFDVATENSWMQLDSGGQHSSIVLHGSFIMLRTSLLWLSLPWAHFCMLPVCMTTFGMQPLGHVSSSISLSLTLKIISLILVFK